MNFIIALCIMVSFSALLAAFFLWHFKHEDKRWDELLDARSNNLKMFMKKQEASGRFPTMNTMYWLLVYDNWLKEIEPRTGKEKICQ